MSTSDETAPSPRGEANTDTHSTHDGFSYEEGDSYHGADSATPPKADISNRFLSSNGQQVTDQTHSMVRTQPCSSSEGSHHSPETPIQTQTHASVRSDSATLYDQTPTPVDEAVNCIMCAATNHNHQASSDRDAQRDRVKISEHPEPGLRQATLLDPACQGYDGRCKKVGQYLLGRTIGEGSYGKVRLATHLMSKQQVAVKVVAKKTLVQREVARRHFRREALMLQRVHHPHVTRLYQALETGNSYYLVFELATGGSLLDLLSRQGNLTEEESRYYMRQVVSALDHLHKSDIVHRDLKLENILLDERSNVKLVDFGLSAVCQDSNSALSTQCGSPLYAAPELFAARKYGKPVDVWSLGVCLFAMLTGRLPFLPGEGASLLQLYSLVLKGCELPQWASQPCKNLLSRMLDVHESRRISVDEILSHDWLVGPDGQPIKRFPPVPRKLPELTVDPGVVKYMCTMFRFSERDVVTSVVERKLTPAAATYHILHDSIEAGRLSISFTRDITGVGPRTTVISKSGSSNRPAKDTDADGSGSGGVNFPDIKSASANSTFANKMKENNSAVTSELCGRNRIGKGAFSDQPSDLHGPSIHRAEETAILVGNISMSEQGQRHRGSSTGSADSGVGAEILSEESRLIPREQFDIAPKLPACQTKDSDVGTEILSEGSRLLAGEHSEITPKLSDSQNKSEFTDKQVSYKMFIRGLRQSRQKIRVSNTVAATTPDEDGRDKQESSRYVLFGHSPRGEGGGETKSSIGDESRGPRGLAVPAPTESSRSRFSPTFPPIAMSGPNSVSSSSASSSAQVYPSSSGPGESHTRFTSAMNSKDVSFYYSSRPLPGFRHGNRYFLHLDKSNFSSSNMGVTGVPHRVVSNDARLSSDGFTHRFSDSQSVAAWTRRNLGHSIDYIISYTSAAHHNPPPPPPPNSSTYSPPFSFSSEENGEEGRGSNKGRKISTDMKSKKNGRGTNGQLHDPSPPSPHKLFLNDPSLHVESLGTTITSGDWIRSLYANSELDKVHSENANDQLCCYKDSRKQQQQQHRRPVQTLSSLRDIYGADPWRRSRSEKADLQRSVKQSSGGRQEGLHGRSCELSPALGGNTARMRTIKADVERDKRKPKPRRSSRHVFPSKDAEGSRLNVPGRDDGRGDSSSASSFSRSEVNTPLTPEGEEFNMTPVTRVTITTIGRH